MALLVALLAGPAWSFPPADGAEGIDRVLAARKAVRYGVLAHGESGTFEGGRPLDAREQERLLKVLGAYLGRSLEAAGAFEAGPDQVRDVVLAHWTMARFLRDRRRGFRRLTRSSVEGLDRKRPGVWHYAVVERLGELVEFRRTNLAFMETLRTGRYHEDPLLGRTVRQLGKLLGVMDRRSEELQQELAGLLHAPD